MQPFFLLIGHYEVRAEALRSPSPFYIGWALCSLLSIHPIGRADTPDLFLLSRFELIIPSSYIMIFRFRSHPSEHSTDYSTGTSCT